MSKRFLLILGPLLWTAAAQAYDIRALRHSPPTVKDARLPLLLTIPAEGLKDARVLVVGKDGYHALSMKHKGDAFEAEIQFTDLAELVYEFQIRASDGATYESEFYSIQQPGDPALEKSLAELGMEKEILQARSVQLDNALYAAKQSSGKSGSSSAETGRVLLDLGQKERKAEALRSELAEKLATFSAGLGASERGKQVIEGREILTGERDL